jgi:Na+/H+ antiporter NhaD/arsenite permease-like protein
MKSATKHLCLLTALLVWGIAPLAAVAAPEEGTVEVHPATQPADAHPDLAEGDHSGKHAGHAEHHPYHVPSLWPVLPFVAILLCIAILPLIPATEHWWHKNQSKLLISAILGVITIIYYFMRGYGMNVVHGDEAHVTAAGLEAVEAMLHHAVLAEYVPFIVLLFSLYTICGGIQLRGDLRATPLTNTAFLAIGAGLASFIGTTGAAMLLIRPVLQTNRERRYVRHTVIFFTFLVANIGGSLLPIGDPPLFLGYLRDVPFFWTFNLLPHWAFACVLVLIIYFIWDSIAYRKEEPSDQLLDRTQIEPLRLSGLLNFVWLLGVVLSVILLVPGSKFPGTDFIIPNYMREVAQLVFVMIAWITSSAKIREENKFDFFAITEVAVLFIGIFICMQVPVEILQARGSELGLTSQPHFFWATGTLSSFLDNAPTYVVFFETAKALPIVEGVAIVEEAGIAEPLLVAVSLGAVFMGAMTYIGNGPNFMVKSIAEQAAVKMPSFFGYMIYSIAVLIPVFVLVNIVFFVLLK